jgi:hypothetical protein
MRLRLDWETVKTFVVTNNVPHLLYDGFFRIVLIVMHSFPFRHTYTTYIQFIVLQLTVIRNLQCFPAVL